MGVYPEINVEVWDSFFQPLIASISKIDSPQFTLMIKNIFDGTKSQSSFSWSFTLQNQIRKAVQFETRIDQTTAIASTIR